MEQKIKVTVDSIKIIPLDMGRMAKDATEKLANGFGWHIGQTWGIIEEPRPCLVCTECVVWTPKDWDAESIKLDIFKDDQPLEDGTGFSIAMFPQYHMKVSLVDLVEYKTQETKNLREFMGDRFDYNPRLMTNQANLLRWLEGEM